ncbi:MAG TPA: hypothetical protein VGD74_02060 [Vulgatibacter sp.]
MSTTDPLLESDREGFRPKAADLLRKAVFSGVGALFMTEEGVRSMVKELKLPKEVLAGAVAQAERTKTEIVRMVGAELRSFLEGSKLREDLLEMLTQVTFEVKAEVSIKPRGEGGAKSRITVKPKAAARRAPRKAKGS